MLQIVSFSGGIGSFCVLKRVVNIFPEECIKVVFIDTLFEDEDLYRFNDNVFGYLKKYYPEIEIIPLCDGRTPIDISREQHLVLNNRFPICSQQLKSKLFKKWLKEQDIKPNEAVIHIGIDNGETRRCPGITKNYKHPVRYLLIEQGITDKAEMLNECAEWGIDIPRLYKLGFDHNNCGGRCFRAGIKHFTLLHRVLPERFEEMKTAEKELADNARLHHGTDREYAILKRRKQPYTLEMLEADIRKEES